MSFRLSTHLESYPSAPTSTEPPRTVPNGPLQQPANKIDTPPVYQRSTDSYLVPESRPTAYLDSRFWPMWVCDGVPPGSINATNAISISGIVARSRRINCRGTQKFQELWQNFGTMRLVRLLLAPCALAHCPASLRSTDSRNGWLFVLQNFNSFMWTNLRLDDCHVFESNKRD